MRKRYHFTLLEVLIALSLSAILLTSVLFFYRYLSELSFAVNQIEIENFQARRVETRLAQVFYAIVGEPYKGEPFKIQPPKNPATDKPPENRRGRQKPEPPKPVEEAPTQENKKDKLTTFVFFTGDDEGKYLKSGSSSLTFIFDNGPTMNTPFANQVLVKLFIDKQNRLCLAYWPHPKFWSLATLPPMNLEVLLENVDSMFFSFYVPLEQEQEKGESKFPELRPGEWTNQWQREYGAIPPAVRVGIIYTDMQGKQKTKTFAYPLTDSVKVIGYKK